MSVWCDAEGHVAPLLRTKLYIPTPRPQLVSRRWLIDRLNEGLRAGCRLILLSAPAGFGKTTLLSDWAQEVKPDTAIGWVSLDEGDNDPTRFWSYAIAALQEARPGLGASALAGLRSPQPPPIEALLTPLINELIAVPQPTLLVLDDLHVVTAVAVHAALAFLLAHLPPGVHLVIATRSDPDLPLSRLRGRGQLVELSASDLRFTGEEATAFLNRAMGLQLPAQQVHALASRTEGWVVGLQMAGRALQRDPDQAQVAGFIADFAGSHRYVLDYLTDEVLLREPASVQDFLLRTSILQRLTGPLCDAVTGLSSGQEMLERLDAGNLFVVPLDNERRWYRYHHLFAELLLVRLRRAHPEALPGLHLRASVWHEAHGSIEEAIAHALAGGDYRRGAQLVERHAVRQMMSHRQERKLAEWLEALPDELVAERPWLCVYLAWTRYWMGMRDQVEVCLQRAERALHELAASDPGAVTGDLGAPQSDQQLIAGYIAAIRAHHALTDEQIPRVLEQARQAIAFLPEGDYMRCEAAVALGGACWSLGDVEASEKAFAQARETALKSGYPPLAVPSACYAGMQQAKQGRLAQAHATYRDALHWAIDPGGQTLPVAGFPLIRLGDLSREWNDLDQAERQLAQGLALCIQLGQADVAAEAHVLLARLQLTRSDLDAVPLTLCQADQIAQRVSIDPWIRTWADECRIRLWNAQGDLGAAIRWMELSGLRLDDPLDYHRDLHHTNLARVLIARGTAAGDARDLIDALTLLDRLLDAARRARWVSKAIEVQILRAVALYHRHERAEARTALADALLLAQPGGFVRTFLDEGEAVAMLLREAPLERAPADYVRQLLAAFGEQQAPSTAERAGASALVEPLSDREMQVLSLIAAGHTNREIGEQLYISQGTVKAHTSNIYGKLGVRSRTEAVARARALGIL
ncbi:MAG: AAA family ATPase [Anaerolineae bacterium]|nr:AAA family ATPase [Anaerolineae bacterium]